MGSAGEFWQDPARPVGAMLGTDGSMDGRRFPPIASKDGFDAAMFEIVPV
jgi:hypothetical protein